MSFKNISIVLQYWIPTALLLAFSCRAVVPASDSGVSQIMFLQLTLHYLKLCVTLDFT